MKMITKSILIFSLFFLIFSSLSIEATREKEFNPSSAGDGDVQYNEAASWNEAHDAKTGTSAQDSETLFNIATVITQRTPQKYSIRRGFLPIDLTNEPKGAKIETATMYIKLFVKVGGNKGVVLVGPTSQDSTSALITADFDQCGAVDNPKEWTDTIAFGDIGGWTTWTFNSLGKTAINDAFNDWLMLGIRVENDCDDVAPTVVNDFLFYSADDSNNKPILNIQDYSLPQII